MEDRRLRAGLAQVFTPLARGLNCLGISPNLVTITGTVVSIAVALTAIPLGYLKTGVAILTITVFSDSLDGVLARLSGRTTRFGAVLDASLDRLCDGAIFAGFAAFMVFQVPDRQTRVAGFIAALAALVFAFGVSYVRARGEAVGVIAKIGLAERSPRLLVVGLTALLVGLGLNVWILVAGLAVVAAASLTTMLRRLFFIYRSLECNSNGSCKDRIDQGISSRIDRDIS